MKKCIAFLTALLLCLSCMNVTAVEEEPNYLDSYDYILGGVGEYDLAYKASEELSDNFKCVILGSYYFYSKSDSVPLYLVNNEKSVILEQAYGTIINDLDAVVKLLSKAIESGEIKSDIMTFENIKENADIEPSEYADDEAPATPDESGIKEPTDPMQWEEPTAPDPTEVPCIPETIVTTENDWNPWTPPAPTIKPSQPVTMAPTKAPAEPATSKNTKATDVIDRNNTKTSINSNSSCVASAVRLNIKTATLKCGKKLKLKVKNTKKTIKFSSGNKKIATVSKKGVVVTLKKGRVKITAKVGKKKLSCVVKVVSSPRLSETDVVIKKGGYAAVKIIGRAPSVKNKYKGTEKAAITAKAKADSFKIKGLKRGKTTVKVRVNGVLLKVKVRIR